LRSSSTCQRYVLGVLRQLRHLRRLTQSCVQKGQRITYIYVYACPLAPGRDPPLEFITAQESGLERARVWLRLGPFPLEVAGGEVAPRDILAQEW
jgi:hypothetical protein